MEPMQMDLEENENVGQQVEGAFVVENPTLDLENYINNYTGMAKLFRLIHIADHSPALRLEALKMAIEHVKNTFNVAMYQQLHKKMRDAAGIQQLPDVAGEGDEGAVPMEGAGGSASSSSGVPAIDMTWIEQKSKKAAMKLEKLDADLKNYKSNSIKESIRRGHDDLAEHYLDIGDLTNALKCFSRARDYCTSAKHVVNMCLNVIKVSIYLQNWSHVMNFVTRAESTPDIMDQGKANSKENLQVLTKLKCSAGLADLAHRKYKSAAKFFLEANFDHCDFSDILSPNNVAVYGGLCALASFDREELRKYVISSNSFKLFLDIEPQIRIIIFQFYESKYASCLRLLDEMKDNFYLDLYLSPHIRVLYGQIRNRGLIQYFTPYSSADLNLMASCFNTSVSDLEDELIELILDGQIEARIDSHNKILFERKIDQRSATFERCLRVGADYERSTKLMILTTALIQAKIQVRNPEGQNDVPGNSNFRVPRE